jgi:glycosyltransferase involved in cell wall biosynthesis
MKVCVVVPAYNASTTLQQLLAALLPYDKKIVVVDDGSDDKTSVIAEKFAAHNVTLLRHGKNRGKGAALRTGLSWASENGFDAVVTMDSDLQHSPADLPGLLEIFDKHTLDLLIGSRLHDQQDMPKSRRLGNWFSSLAGTKWCHQKIYDSQCGYRIYRLASFEKTISELKLNRFAFESEVLIRASLNLLRIGFSPISVIYPGDALHTSFYRPWLDTFTIIYLGGKAFLRRTFLPAGRRELNELKKYVKSCSDWPRYYQLPGTGKKNSLG